MTLEELKAVATRWQSEISLYERLTTDWEKRGCRVIERFLDERKLTAQGVDVTQEAKFNILWSNYETMFPAVYAKGPKPQVSRRYQDQDPVGRVASNILERCLEFELEQYSDFDSSIKAAISDRLLPGRGVAWVRYEPTFGERVQVSEDDVSGEYAEGDKPEPVMEEYLEHECAPTDYVNWKDFGHCHARTWEEVSGVWRAVYLSKGELRKRFEKFAPVFGYKIDDIPLNHIAEEVRDAGGIDVEKQHEKKACVYEVWDKANKRAIWINESIPVPLDLRDDPLGLDGFFPCPKPLYATISTDTLIPVPDFCMYQDQARELDEVTNRIGMLTKALKVVGVYDGSQKGIKRMLNEGVNNTLIPVDTWAAFAEKGGIKGVIDFMPLVDVVAALENLYKSRQEIKQVIYEVTGIADIIRGSTDPDETLGAQQIKANFAGLRIKRTRADVSRFGRDLVRLKAEIICGHYSDETIVEMSGARQIPEVMKTPQILPEALQLLRNDVIRDFRIDIETDSMVEIDEEQDRQATGEMVAAIGSILKEGLPVVQAVPELGIPIGETLMMIIRKFRAGKNVEAVWDDAMQKLQQRAQMPQQQAPDPRLQVETVKAQTAMQVEPVKAQAEVMKAQAGVRQAEIDLQKTALEGMFPAPGAMQ